MSIKGVELCVLDSQIGSLSGLYHIHHGQHIGFCQGIDRLRDLQTGSSRFDIALGRILCMTFYVQVQNPQYPDINLIWTTLLCKQDILVVPLLLGDLGGRHCSRPSSNPPVPTVFQPHLSPGPSSSHIAALDFDRSFWICAEYQQYKCRLFVVPSNPATDFPTTCAHQALTHSISGYGLN